MNCNCKDWKESNTEIQRVFTQAHLRGVEAYKGKEFTHCPWCGEGLVPDYVCDNHCFCRNDALGVLHCCKCGESIKYEYRPYEWRTGLPDYKWRIISTSGLDTVQGKYKDVPTSSDEFAKRKESQSLVVLK